MIIARAICAVLWFIGAMAMVLGATYVWASIIIAAVENAGWPSAILIVVASFFAARQFEDYLLTPWRRWHELWSWFDNELTK